MKKSKSAAKNPKGKKQSVSPSKQKSTVSKKSKATKEKKREGSAVRQESMKSAQSKVSAAMEPDPSVLSENQEESNLKNNPKPASPE